ncbi:TPA: RNA polymerase-associated protein rtf1, variant 3 [Trebouxia sp. C0004]
MAGSDSDDLEDMLLEAGGAGKPSNKRSRDEDVSDASQQDGDSQLSEEVSQEYQAPARKAKASGKKRKTATGSDAADKDDTFDEDAFVFDGYGKDLIRGSADQAELDKLTEFERENELFQRAEARDREIERRRHAKLLQQSRAQQATAHPQTAADKADQMRSSTRQKKPDTGKKDAMAELRARRAQAQERKTTQEVAKKRGRKGGGQDSDEAYTDDEAISESDSDDDRLPAVSAQEASADDLSSGPSPLRDSSEERDVRRDSDRHDKGKALTPDVDKDDEDVPANDAELESLQVKRHTLERWVNEPFFLTTVTGCLVKVAYSGKYHLAEIVDVQEREPGKHRDMGVNVTYPYQFGSGTTRKVLLIRRGNSDRVCPMYVVSNKTLDAQDLCSLTAYNEDQRMPQITRSHTNRKKEELMKAHNYTYTAADVKQMLAEKKARGSSRVNIAAEKARLTRERDHAQEVGDINEIERTEAELSHLEHRQANSERHANKQAFGMSNVNQRNKHTNFMNAYKNVSSAPDNQKVALQQL